MKKQDGQLTGHVIDGIEPGSIAEELEIEPGDTLVSVNGSPITDVFDYQYLTNEEYLEILIRKADGEEWEREIEKEFEEDLAGAGVRHHILNDDRAPNYVPHPDRFPNRNMCTYNVEGFACTVPRGYYFMMGDNRDNSLDSRYWGFVPDDYIVGKAFLVWMNLGDMTRIGGIR